LEAILKNPTDMIIFRKKNRPIQQKEELKSILKRIIDILQNSENCAQSRVMENALNALQMNNDNEFITVSKSIDIWGGSGAVWEVYINDEAMMQNFYFALLRYADILIENGIKNRRLRSTVNLLNQIVLK
jgi:hypothetical protein